MKLGESNWWRTGLGMRGLRGVSARCLLSAACLLSVAACGAKDKPNDSDKSEESAEEADDDEKKKKDEEGDDKTIGDGPTVNRRAKGIPEAESYLADSGFRPAKNGFLFPNGDRDDRGRRIQFPANSPGHLDKDGMQRLFGSEKVCLGLEEHGGECLLTPGAHEFMNMVNRKMNGGQCEGLAVFALSLFSGKDPVSVFEEGATLASDLDQNTIRGPVGYYFSYQFLQPFRNTLFGDMMKTTPNGVLDTVIKSFEDKDDPVALEFFQPGVGGHAVVPYAVEDKGNNIFHVRIWDNNFPRASRYIEFDKNKDTWLYSFAAINPSEDARPWGGGASRNTIVATRVSKRMDKPAVCPFCEKKTGIRMLMTAGGVNALVTDSQGRKIGMENGKLVNEIPGASAYPVMSFVPGEEAPEPLYELPDGEDYDVKLVGSGHGGNGTVGVFGTDHAMVVEDINIDKGGEDHVNLSRDGESLDYTPGSEGRNPKVRLAMGTGDDSYRIELDDLKPKKGHRLGFKVNRRDKSLAVTDDGKERDNVHGKVTRFTRKGRQHTVKLTPRTGGPKGRVGKRVRFGQMTNKMPAAKPRTLRKDRPATKRRTWGRRPARAGAPTTKPQNPTTKPSPARPLPPRKPNRPKAPLRKPPKKAVPPRKPLAPRRRGAIKRQ